MTLNYLRDEIADLIKNVFPERKIIRGFPVNIKLNELPACYIYLDKVTFGLLTFNTYITNVSYVVDLLYDAQKELDYNRRGYTTEDIILEDMVKAMRSLYNLDKILQDGSFMIVLENVEAENLLEREGLYRILRITVNFKITKGV